MGSQVPLESLVLYGFIMFYHVLLSQRHNKWGVSPSLFGQAMSKPLGFQIFQVCFSRAEVLEAKSQLEAAGKRTLISDGMVKLWSWVEGMCRWHPVNSLWRCSQLCDFLCLICPLCPSFVYFLNISWPVPIFYDWPHLTYESSVSYMGWTCLDQPNTFWYITNFSCQYVHDLGYPPFLDKPKIRIHA